MAIFEGGRHNLWDKHNDHTKQQQRKSPRKTISPTVSIP